MPTVKPKTKTTRRRAPRKSGSTPIPCGPAGCGHEGTCSTDECRVRYVGPVSHLRDHHAFHAARGSAHIWAAAVTTGLALVLTGAIAYASIEARNDARAAAVAEQTASSQDVERIVQRLDKLERTQADMEVMLQHQYVPPSENEVFKNTLP